MMKGASKIPGDWISSNHQNHNSLFQLWYFRRNLTDLNRLVFISYLIHINHEASMKKPAIILFSILLIFVGSITMGCSSSPASPASPSQPSVSQAPEQTQKANTGFTVNNLTMETPVYNFDDVVAYVSGIEFDNGNGTLSAPGSGHIQQIRGDGLDENANATLWLITIRHDSLTSLVSFDEQGEKVVDWPGAYPRDEIFSDRIIHPKDLFDKNRAVIFPTPDSVVAESREIALAEGTYTLTVSGKGTNRVMVFDAKTGVLISSHD
jgi:hypothetical protein